MNKNISIEYAGGAIDAYEAAPEEKTRAGLIVIEEIWGVNDHIKDVSRRFADQGYLVISPELLDPTVLQKISPEIAADMWGDDAEKKHQAQAKMREAIGPIFTPDFAKGAMEKLNACVDYLMNDERSHGTIGVLGFCFGGTYSFQLAIHDERIKAAVPFYGQPPEPFDTVATIGCPVLNFNGAHDANIVPKLPALAEAMKKYGKEYTNITYPDAGHAFFNDTNARAYNAAAAKDAWEKTITFLEKNLA